MIGHPSASTQTISDDRAASTLSIALQKPKPRLAFLSASNYSRYQAHSSQRSMLNYHLHDPQGHTHILHFGLLNASQGAYLWPSRGSILVLAEPLSISSLADLLNMTQDDCQLRSLHSVLRVPADFETPVRTLHLSFGELLLSEKLQHQPFGVDGPATHRMLLTKCLNLLSGSNGLRENMCDLSYPGQP
jgi:hypothetical protein